MRGLGLRATLAGRGRPLDTPPRLAASPAPHRTGLHPGGDTRSAPVLQGQVCGCVGWMCTFLKALTLEKTLLFAEPSV